ncbi:unnamed protein product [Paramecium sonneborni]|uniref:Uncharacterized protein n=1 Tax=Paramecium sonneborni TaxID=65129 RepID=A0A8S1NE39_9CILI|nr:unnamed protein product [Paramecium sonneborni]
MEHFYWSKQNIQRQVSEYNVKIVEYCLFKLNGNKECRLRHQLKSTPQKIKEKIRQSISQKQFVSNRQFLNKLLLTSMLHTTPERKNALLKELEGLKFKEKCDQAGQATEYLKQLT